ncbi:MAG: EAL domain-containing protein [Oscillospiraceae bacterium]|nr:EAL domain-containing protein [Oscillospiraceae bacterium]
MDQKHDDYSWVHDLLSEVISLSSEQKRAELLSVYREQHTAETDRLILRDADVIAEMLIQSRYAGGALNKIASLTEAEREELEETERILDENLFDYYFQPIVNTIDGEIYSYEALMRPKSEMKLTPLKVLRYAGLVNRLDDIEKDTFLNVLGIIDLRKNEFSGKFVFINSIPEVKLNADDFKSVTRMLLKHADTAVVEMTEQSEVDDESLEKLKERYRNMGIRMAIDDYGSGYSNVGNLLRYMPNFVKIDRSLLTEIHKSPKKRHFVREIIQFCHDNDILALAEGVETADELHTVIMLGADLVQGYFTAKPSPEIITSIPEEIRQLIRRYRQERENGIGQQVYMADCTERILLERLIQTGMKRIVIGAHGNGDVTLEGDVNTDTELRVETRSGFTGKIILENAWLTSIKNKPCIDIGENSDVTLVLIGENKLEAGGIRVPESSKLTVTGDGKLDIELDSDEYYGIGNGVGLLHGELIFEQSGRITVNAHGQTGVAIGSGSGGIIRINQGQYRLNLQGDAGLGIGAMYSQCNLVIHDCDIGMELTFARGAAIGSINRMSCIEIYKTSTKIFMSGVELIGIGTVGGESSKLSLREASCIINIKGECCSAIAALDGRTDLAVERASVRLGVEGKQVFGFGGFTGNTHFTQDTADTHITIDSPEVLPEPPDEERFVVNSGKFVLTQNGKVLYEVE